MCATGAPVIILSSRSSELTRRARGARALLPAQRLLYVPAPVAPGGGGVSERESRGPKQLLSDGLDSGCITRAVLGSVPYSARPCTGTRDQSSLGHTELIA